MKFPSSLLAVLLSSTFALTGVQAQDQSGSGGKGGGDRQERMQRRFDEMKTNLGLSEDQATKIQAIMKENAPAMQALRDDTSLSQEDKRAKFQELRKKTDEQIGAVLTPEQKTKWEAARKEREENRKQRQGNGGGQ
jgi:Spy/CpxP family protein refolding chaperone